VSFGVFKLTFDIHMTTWVSWTLPFDSSSFQDTFVMIGTPQVEPHVPTPQSHHYFSHVIIIFPKFKELPMCTS